MEPLIIGAVIMINVLEKSCMILNKEIKAIIVYTDNGLAVTLAGGDKSHIGAITVVDESGKITTITFPEHKETIISETWAKGLFKSYHIPVVVSAGIHYDVITKEQIAEVVEASYSLLNLILEESKDFVCSLLESEEKKDF